MTNMKTFGTAGTAVGVALAASACVSTIPEVAVLDSGSSAQPVPDAVQTSEQFADGSARYLGEIDDYSYFAARPASGADHEACLVQIDSTADDWIGGCSTIRQDKVVVLSGGAPRQEVALISDNPSTDTLEEAGWEKQADNLWYRSD